MPSPIYSDALIRLFGPETPWILTALLCLAALCLAGVGRPRPPRSELTPCSLWGEPVLCEFPALSGFSPELPPPGACRARLYSLDGAPLWSGGAGWAEFDFSSLADSLVAIPLDPASELYPRAPQLRPPSSANAWRG